MSEVKVAGVKDKVRLSTDRCVDCGACTAVCLPGALYMDRTSWALIFNEDKCCGCQLCVKACPVGAIFHVCAEAVHV